MAREDVRHDANCFADEVTIDFPSVDRAVERMRRSFLAADGPQPLRATVELTGHQAATGITLPFDVPLYCMCTRCGGRGETWTERCAQCDGCGWELLRHPVQVTVPAGVRDGSRFCFTVTPRHHRSTRIELYVAVTTPQ